MNFFILISLFIYFLELNNIKNKSSFIYFKRKFPFLKSKFETGLENREMTTLEIAKQGHLKLNEKEDKSKREILISIYKLKYMHLKMSAIYNLVDRKLAFEAKCRRKFNNLMKKKFSKTLIKLKKLQNKLLFSNKGKNFLNISNSEFILNKQLLIKINKDLRSFIYLKKKSKYFFNLSYFLFRKYLEKRGIKHNVYGYKKIKLDKYSLKEAQFNLNFFKFKKKKNKLRLLNFLKNLKKYKYPFHKFSRCLYKSIRYRLLYFRRKKLKKAVFLKIFKTKNKLKKINFLFKKKI